MENPLNSNRSSLCGFSLRGFYSDIPNHATSANPRRKAKRVRNGEMVLIYFCLSQKPNSLLSRRGLQVVERHKPRKPKDSCEIADLLPNSPVPTSSGVFCSNIATFKAKTSVIPPFWLFFLIDTPVSKFRPRSRPFSARYGTRKLTR